MGLVAPLCIDVKLNTWMQSEGGNSTMPLQNITERDIQKSPKITVLNLFKGASPTMLRDSS